MQFFQRRTESPASPRYMEFVERSTSLLTFDPSDLENLIERFGHSLLNVSPMDLKTLSSAVQNNDEATIVELLVRQGSNENVESNEHKFATNEYSHESFFKNAIEIYRTEWVEFYIHMFTDKSFDFEEGARIINNSFKTIWKHYNSLAIEILENDILSHDICSIDVPIEVFTDESKKGSRVGTCASITKWTQTTQTGAGASLNYWLEQNPKEVGSILEQSKTVLVKASIKIYCFEDVYKVGLNEILRFLLLNRAPTSLYKTPLIKHIVEFKWERDWKKQTHLRLRWFLMFYVLFPIIIFGIAHSVSVATSVESYAIFYPIFATWLILLAMLKMQRARQQLTNYIHDSQEIFSSSSLSGIKHYMSSQQNIVELFLLLTKLFIVAEVLYMMLGNTSSRNSPMLSGSLAFLILLVVAELYYRLQIIKKCGVTAMMVEQIVVECLPYFGLLLMITTAFGLVMWRACVTSLHSKNDEEDENELMRSFANPLKAILTMFYATFGLFDPTEMYQYGSIRWLMLPIFILYLAFQMIIILNVLIAAIGDAFDGLKSIEEELFLEDRADFIDRSEASLTKKKIEPIKESIGKYLYVLVPKEKHLKKGDASWKGRMITIKEDVKKIVFEFQEDMTQRIDQQSERIDGQIQSVMDHMTQIVNHQTQSINQLNQEIDQQSERIDGQIQNVMDHLTQIVDHQNQNINQLAQKMDLLTENMNKMFKLVRDDIRSMDERIKTLEK